MERYILVIDEGTTGVRALIYDRQMKMIDYVYETLELYYPGPDEVEADPVEIYDKTVKVCREVVDKCGISVDEIAGVGITTQRTSWLVWNKETGQPLRNAVLWLDARGRHQKQKFVDDPLFNAQYPGLAGVLPGVYMPLILDKICDEDKVFADEFKKDTTLYGNIDTWLIWKMTGGKVHAVSSSMISASTLYDNGQEVYSQPLIGYFGVRNELLPEIREESDFYGNMSAEILGKEIPICSSIADQQSAMFSQGCVKPNTVKCTMGTGTFIDINVGEDIKIIPTLNNMITWKLDGKVNYLLEGMASTAGACLEWAKKSFNLFDDFSEMDDMAESVKDHAGVYFIPALAGMIVPPYNDESARGAFMGIGPGATRAHFIRAMLEGIAFAAVLLMEEATNIGVTIEEIKVSGGVTKSSVVMQTIASVTGAKVVRPKSVEATALGAAETAAIKLGWMSIDDIENYLEIDKVIRPNENSSKIKDVYSNWKKVVNRTLKWDC
ncbi:MAG: FGGY family carbohydrate kinase [Eubacterium sp.]